MRFGRGLIAAVVLGLVAATVVTAALVAATEDRSTDSERRGEAARAAADLESRFELSVGALSTIQGLFAASNKVTGPEFETFASRLLPGAFSATLLVQRVPAELRRDFELSPGSSPVTEPFGGAMRAAGRRSEYYPVAYRYSSYAGADRSLPIGLDLAADPARGPVLRAARDTATTRATSPVVLPESGRRGLLLFLPIYSDGAPLTTVEERRAAIQSFAVSAFEAKQLGDEVLRGRRPGTELQIFDGGRRLYGPDRELDDAMAERVRAGGRTWTVELQTPVEASPALPGTILGGGLALSGLVALLLTALARRERYAQELSDRRLTERTAAEGARRAAEERFTRAFEDSGVGMALVAASDGQPGGIIEVNAALSQMTGYPAERLLKMGLLGLVHPDDRAAAEVALRRVTAGAETTTQSERRLVDALGQSVWVLASTSIVRDEHGRPSHQIVQLQDVSERKRFEGQLQHLADHDPLTGVYNRRRFEEELARELDAATRYGRSGAVLALDLDHFKYINDSLGHSVGDELIARVSSLLQERLGDGDILARLGGDEFAVILPEAGERKALDLAESLLHTIRVGAVVGGPHGQVGTTASIGVAVFSEEPGGGGEELLAEADIAMYDAKDAGRDRCALFSPSARDARMAERLTWVDRIRRALAEDRFVLHGQRIESLDHDDPRVREELLLRMVGDDGGLIPPAVFLPLAERFDLICEIDRWVVHHAIELLARLQQSGVEAVLEVNLSAKSVTDPALPDFIRAEISDAGVDPSGLVFEMTETAAIVNLDRAKHFAAFVRGAGCEFALDDFGAGFASFYYLKHLAFDYLKIDGEFIEDLADSSTNQLLVRALVEIAQGLGKRTIAEFVEDGETLELLRELGVDYVQGYHVARPRPVDVEALSPAGAAPAEAS